MARPELLTSADLPVSFGRFELLCILGEGGMARVFRARMTGPSGFRKQIALKVIHRDNIASRDAVEQLNFEARATAQFNFPHIITIHAVGEHQGHPYVALEYLQGQTLRERLREERPGQREALAEFVRVTG